VGAGDIQQGDVVDLLSRLVDKSLVVAEAQEVVRYRMLEPIRQYARERFEESEEVEAVKRRHAEFYLVLAEEAEPGVEGPQQAAWLERLEAEHDNLRTALSWSLERGEEAELGLRVGEALGQFWYLRGYFGEGRRWLEEALAKASPASTAARHDRVASGGGDVVDHAAPSGKSRPRQWRWQTRWGRSPREYGRRRRKLRMGYSQGRIKHPSRSRCQAPR
jgi:hypothetical protein